MLGESSDLELNCAKTGIFVSVSGPSSYISGRGELKYM